MTTVTGSDAAVADFGSDSFVKFISWSQASQAAKNRYVALGCTASKPDSWRATGRGFMPSKMYSRT